MAQGQRNRRCRVRYRGSVHAPDFPPGLVWLNVSRPLGWDDLRGRLVILEMWTSG